MIREAASDFVTVGDGARLAFERSGATDAPTLVLVHSLGTSSATWDELVPVFAPTLGVVRFDLRGHGRSEVTPGSYSLDRLGRDIIELMDALAISRAAVCGVSLGGMIGQWLGVRAPERLSRLVLANTSAFMGPPSNWQRRIEAVLRDGLAELVEPVVSRWLTEDFRRHRPDALERARRVLEATSPQGYAGACAAIRDMDQRSTVKLISTPTLVIAGSEDAAVPPSDARYLAENIRDARLAFLPAAHLSHLERPREFAEEVLRFVRGA
jgi:3-oxoadipate enol-lactonase